MEKEKIYFMVVFKDGHRGFMSSTLPLWSALHLYYNEDNVRVVKMLTRDEYYENMHN